MCGVRYVANLMITYGGTVQMRDATYVIKLTPPTLVHTLTLANGAEIQIIPRHYATMSKA